MAALLTTATLLAPAFALAHPRAAFEGRPGKMRQGLTERVWVWVDGTGLHIRWTTAAATRRFSGTISPRPSPEAGPISAVSNAGETTAPRVRMTEDPDRGPSVSFEASSGPGIAGLNLPPANPGESYVVALAVDSLPAPLHLIRLGRAEIHPRHNPFAIPVAKAPPTGGDHHEHSHRHPHAPGRHHHHAHPHPHPPGVGHHHAW